jgi:hypothetical protein
VRKPSRDPILPQPGGFEGFVEVAARALGGESPERIEAGKGVTPFTLSVTHAAP